MGDPWSTETDADAANDTIALLQEEITRLESELQSRDEPGHAGSEGSQLDSRPTGHDEATRLRLAGLTDELAAREETISLLLEQLRLAEEAEAAGRAEWEQLQGWVEEVENRVAQQGGSESNVRQELAEERRKLETLRRTAELEQRSWETQRQALVGEADRLRRKFTEVAAESDTSLAAVRALELENQQFRAAYQELAQNAVPGHEVDAIVEELQSVRKEREAIAQELQRERDDRRREGKEQEAALCALRSQLARESLHRQEEQVKTTVLPPTHTEPRPELDPDHRIRAFREHLKEIHHDEVEQRLKQSLASRLSRLWHHTSPHS
jgi:hypothetical protein